MNNIKDVIQKEEYIALALNKYVLQTGTIPKKNDDSLDWDKLMVEDYLGINFNKINPFTSKEIKVVFDTNNNAYIKGAIEQESDYSSNDNYLYNFYTNKVFRVNTIAPKNITKSELAKGSLVLYNDIQKQIASVLKDNTYSVLFPSQNCTSGKYFYELKDEKLNYKYCKTNGTALTVFQESPIYLEDWDDLQYIRANIGSAAFVQKNGEWFEYYYQGKLNIPWIPVGEGEKLASQQEEESEYIEKISSYIPNAKDLFIRQSGGCMLASGDIFCWGNNDYKKAGVSSYGQLDNTLSPTYVNTPVMLKTQIDNIKIGSTIHDLNSKKWYNNPYRVKFDKMAMNRSNVCGITKIFEYVEGNTTYKYGGDLYCDGNITSTYYEDLSSSAVESNILKRNKSIYTGKSTQVKNSNAIYLKDIAMIEDVTALLSDNGKIYVIGKNYKGSLGLDKSDNFYSVNTPTPIVANSNIIFQKIFALRDSRTFGAIDSNNIFYIWGERGSSVITKPTIIASSKQFNPDAIFVNTNEFVLKDIDGTYYKTKGNTEIQSIASDLNGTNPISLSYYKDNKNNEYLLYIDENLTLRGTTSLLTCKESDETSSCDNNSNETFDSSINYLNTANNVVSDKLANFTNVSIFKLDHQIQEVDEDFENKDYIGWNRNVSSYYGNTNTGNFLGEWGANTSGTNYLYKTFDFGVENKNKSVSITLDFYQIGTWKTSGSKEYFYVYTNGVTKKTFTASSTAGTSITIGSESARKNSITASDTLDSNGKITLGFSSNIDGSNGESWGVDNIEIKSGTIVLNYSDFEVANLGWKDYLGNSINNVTSIIDNGDITQVPATTFLGRFPVTYSCSGSYGDPCKESKVKPYIVTKEFSFPGYANYEVEIEFDFYEIDTWDGERFEFYANDELLAVDHFVMDGQQFLKDSNITGINLQDNIRPETGYASDQTYRYKIRTKLDSNAKVTLKFQTNFEFTDPKYANDWSKFDEGVDNESWGIDNVKVKLKETYKKFVCAMTGIEDASQMYCWGNVARSVPILSTSLYDVDKISTTNKLFITQDSEKSDQMSFDEYFNDGKLFLKYPTYIGGFDYPFYFR
ncbi:hypothetical protein AVENP_0158 [Arcobacter venerupis]|uniref:Uncharacterized protein n=1 Tax=Arcobacter venerupis TaxID=1054033 RepID=A0AAE7E247_9BACT|nr:hypothetical protein [Arcobacter venerupis]QKF65738.1 hypothetical protein AVENP_0158 [Arcobacter venerupis]RWS50248.1 hypothetical protein CKA56_04755 [Arcobacter venerupis]